MATSTVRPALTKADYAYAEARERIISGVLPHRAVVNQEALAAELDVSTTPLREAMRRLSSEGLVILDAHRDARVAPLTAAEARSLFEIRQQLDPLAVRLAAERRDDADAAHIRAAAASLEPLDAGSGLAALEAHRAFHAALYRASHNDLLIGLLDGLWDKADRYRRAALETREDSPNDRPRVQAGHQAMMAPVLAGDAEGAAAALTAHLAPVSAAILRRLLDSDAELFVS